MANLATVLKEEIRRLARRETKTLTETMRRQSAQHRRDIADLKRKGKRSVNSRMNSRPALGSSPEVGSSSRMAGASFNMAMAIPHF